MNNQILTYLGNKRALIDFIFSPIPEIQNELGKEKLVFADLFSGSGVVAQNAKKFSSKVIANDLESYSRILNECYLSNYSDFDSDEFNGYLKELMYLAEAKPIEGLFCENYAPKDTNNIKEGERCFFTRENAILIDSIRYYIDYLPEHLQKVFIARLLVEMSIHSNTAGHFKAFYKSKSNGLGKFGGDGENALCRIMSPIKITAPSLSKYISDIEVYQKDANQLVREMGEVDVAYIDPPYNQHPFGSNYHILNTVLSNEIPENISKVSGIPKEWNRSAYNYASEASKAFDDLIADVQAKYVLVSYSNEGIISFDEIRTILSKYGELRILQKEYNTYRGSRNLNARTKYVNEYLFVLKKH